jgi:NAD(P)-dependent dehydrogenase (short-subunit alcohol dehydrogenase family)
VSDLAIITGASSGIGAALATSVPFPAKVVDISRSGPPRESGIHHIAADLSVPEEWRRVGDLIVGLVAEHDPGRAMLIHNAGTLAPIGFAGAVDSDAYLANVMLNSASGQVLGHHFLRAVAGRSGIFDLVMITSGAASGVYPGWSAYGAGKAALDQWVRTVGAEQARRGGVRVVAIAPGVVATKMQAEIRDTDQSDFPDVARFHDLHDRGELITPEEAASRIWKTIEDGVEPGSVVDVRLDSAR